MAMEIIRDPESYRQACAQARALGNSLGLVPTMGALHRGHLALCQRASELASFVAVSIFVNPTQFGPDEDLERYPRTLEQDCERCARAGVALVFAPSMAAMYRGGEQTRVRVSQLTEGLCGVFRPVHFEGVATIVTKLLVLTGPCVAVFGRKDYQQLRVIHRLVEDLFLPVEVVGVPTVREPDGLALSSRNVYLSDSERRRATEIPRALGRAVAAYEQGQRDGRVLQELVRGSLDRVADGIDYVELADPDSVVPLDLAAELPGRALLAVAVRIGKGRLIDNVVLGEDPPPEAVAGPEERGG